MAVHLFQNAFEQPQRLHMSHFFVFNRCTNRKRFNKQPGGGVYLSSLAGLTSRSDLRLQLCSILLINQSLIGIELEHQPRLNSWKHSKQPNPQTV